MPEKLLTLRELSEYLGITESRIRTLVDEKSLPAYRIGGELLRFRKEQIDAMRSEIDSRVTDADRISPGSPAAPVAERPKISNVSFIGDTAEDRIRDFFHFNDFYIVSAVLIVILLVVIIRG